MEDVNGFAGLRNVLPLLTFQVELISLSYSYTKYKCRNFAAFNLEFFQSVLCKVKFHVN